MAFFGAQLAIQVASIQELLRLYVIALRQNYKSELRTLLLPKLRRYTPRQTGRLARSYYAKFQPSALVVGNRAPYARHAQFRPSTYGGIRRAPELVVALAKEVNGAAQIRAIEKTNKQFGL